MGNAGRGKDSQDRVGDPGLHLGIPKQSYLSQNLTQIVNINISIVGTVLGGGERGGEGGVYS
jgi:hypothetical protein